MMHCCRLMRTPTKGWSIRRVVTMAVVPVNSMQLVPFMYARRHGLFVREITADAAIVCYRDDANLLALTELREQLGRPLKLERLSIPDFDSYLQRFYESDAGAAAAVIDTLDQSVDLQDLTQHLPEPEDLMESADDAPIIRLINALLTQAVKEGASDIHIEPYAKQLRIRYRIDGVLR